ncbi:hypothetical protein [Streptomyces sp. DH24]|uniref:effector-associated constant component EACC1 n=1 Tax=Streptomyces sp. DH24 TaxID=3040123 RepID=UPI002440F7F9|nr:hypothetical protein [Streptomyces sp. DH24]MDG9719929.1 hypothetical protein [Streptomyces sp. DH24]
MSERLRIRFEGDGPDREEELRSLLGWLADDRSLRGHVRLERIAGDRPGRMSPELAAVLAVISTATGVLQLPLAYLAWRESRRHRTPSVTVQVVGADSAEAEDLLRRLRGEDPDDGSGDAGT